ncbi:tyrosine-type recombinase/integrase [Luteimonas sp. R10]|uniref:tyrosine-type recombinase/integrase n=1 Tax=Luteimonas sp. R10 TaxID=3108176 RepID=UPI0030918DA0|nr:integrase family protein [Luteimonas sp. R10]
MAKFPFTDASVRELEPPDRLHRIDYDVGPVRGLAIQTNYTGAKRFLLVYVAKASGRERRMVLGEFGRAPKLSVSAARRLGAEKRALVDLGRDPWLEAKEQRAAAEAKRLRAVASLGRLCDGYVAMLRAAGKPSADKVEASLRLHVQEPFPALWKAAAADVTLDDLVRIPNRLTKAGKHREASKVRAYLRAAFAAAIASRGDGGIAHHFEGFDLTINPVRDLAQIKPKKAGEGAPRKRALTLAELRAYWEAIHALEGAEGALLRFHLLTGAQRVEQLARMTKADHDPDLRVVTLWDAKGRRAEPRRHLVPLVKDAEAALKVMQGDGPFLFTLTAGEKPAAYHTVWERVQDVSDALVAAKKVGAPFTPGELRKTVETRLAAAGVSKEIRAHLQSHGLGGVQDTHYDDHDYLDEKRAALDRLRGMLEEGKVVPIRKRSRASG